MMFLVRNRIDCNCWMERGSNGSGFVPYTIMIESRPNLEDIMEILAGTSGYSY